MISTELKSLENHLTDMADRGASRDEMISWINRLSAVRKQAEEWEANTVPAQTEGMRI